MSSLLPTTDLVSCFILIDDICQDIIQPQTRGRHPCISTSEIVAILVYNTISLHQKTLKDIWNILYLYHQSDFKHLPTYAGFVHEVHQALPVMEELLAQSLVPAELCFVDSTFLEVCTNHRAHRYKVARNMVAWGKNHQGWHFGFKLNAAVNHQGLLSSIYFTPGDTYDAQVLPALVRDSMKMLVGDSHYGASVMKKYMWKTHGIVIIAPPHYKQKTQLMTEWQQALLHMRSKIESVFDILKQHLHLVSSFPRSANGYFVHFTRILLGYQFSLLLKYLDSKPQY